ncbi:hypothetical protein BLL38_04345 [Pseudomonas gessardii]|nr:hypothetical protein BLL38_04345 [Pseudomonas gessardii]
MHQQVARRVVGEAFGGGLGVVGAGQAVEGVVVVVVLALAGVEPAGEVAAFVVGVAAQAVGVFVLGQAALLVVVVVAEQLALLALVLAAGLEQV